MTDHKNARLIALGCAIIFISTIAVLMARQLSLGPTLPVPAFRSFGPENAPVQITEYTDFACPACRHAADGLEDMLKVYGPAIRLNFKHYPLTGIHPWSLNAAAYADCAGEQGKFKEYGALLFANQEKWGLAKDKPDEFELFAQQLRLDWPKMQVCIETPETLKRIKLEMAEGDMRGVNATPTFFINGKRAVGSGQLIDQARKFDNLLREKK